MRFESIFFFSLCRKIVMVLRDSAPTGRKIRCLQIILIQLVDGTLSRQRSSYA
jgi:hypothetical protein